MATFHWGVLGTSLVSRNFLLGLRACSNDATVTVVASRNRHNAERFAQDFAIPVVAPNYESAASAPEVDALYIATPPSEHECHAMAGIAAGKPVLIEKPFAMNGAAATRIIEAARKHRVFCMEAMWTRFLPLIETVRARIAAGEIGDVRSFRGDFLAANQPDISVSKFDPARGGGALMHRGVYPVSLARLFLGPIQDVQAMANMGITGVDDDCSLHLRHQSGAISTIRASLRTTGVNDFTVHGTKGMINVEAPIYRPFAARITRSLTKNTEGKGGTRFERLKAGGFVQGMKQRAGGLIRAITMKSGTRATSYFKGNGFGYEADALMNALIAGEIESDVMPLDESLEIMTVIDRARNFWQKDT